MQAYEFVLTERRSQRLAVSAVDGQIFQRPNTKRNEFSLVLIPNDHIAVDQVIRFFRPRGRIRLVARANSIVALHARANISVDIEKPMKLNASNR